MTSGFATPATRRGLAAGGLALFLLSAAGPARAQTANESGTHTGATLGPLTVSPNIVWRTEYDDNVFRSAAPMSDFVSTIGTKTDVRGQARRVGLTASGSAEWVHFSKFVSERGANANSDVRVDLILNRIVPYAAASYGSTRQRIHAEIDSRPRIEQIGATVGSIIRFGPRTSIDLSARRARVVYDRGHVTEDVVLHEALNRATEHMSLAFLRHVTPLTRITLAGEWDRAHFEHSPFRNSDNIRLTTGFESDGRIRGRARVGLQVLKLNNQLVPSESRGLFALVGTVITVRDRLQLGIDARRDVEPSYRSGVAYYEGYGFETSATYAIRRVIRISALTSRRFADYRNRLVSGDLLSDRAGTDVETRYGSGVSFLVGNRMSIDFGGAYTERTSALVARRYDGLSVRAGVTHAF